ncbi:hypothetical protein DFJ58DRAFT_811367 [Suillus subalutaceus]|uniref:uncharacterized protein n=1 Tax=Suillus subalutaceus TaxID=48586 RepID=UPI001B86FD43|nr:uncharacterized protein DFJ58DRAFT_811367 [Suillus subalutaceus]KAG1839998.1 hypothetical protein DFJ58DRAFT_811367 [Suillus subalutaceus]
MTLSCSDVTVQSDKVADFAIVAAYHAQSTVVSIQRKHRRPAVMSSEGSFSLSLPTADPLLTITHPQQDIWIIELHGGQDSRLTTRMIDEALRPALDVVEHNWCAMRDKQANDGADQGGRDQDKFFSNGFDYEAVKGNLTFLDETVTPLFARLLTYPIPTLAAINGHAFAAGMMLSLYHFGARWPLSFTAILNAKVGSPCYTGIALPPSEALKAGIVDRLANLTGTSVESGTDKILASRGVWSAINTCLYKDCLEVIYSDVRAHRISPNERQSCDIIPHP